jgi:hypothetical protein
MRYIDHLLKGSSDLLKQPRRREAKILKKLEKSQPWRELLRSAATFILGKFANSWP